MTLSLTWQWIILALVALGAGLLTAVWPMGLAIPLVLAIAGYGAYRIFNQPLLGVLGVIFFLPFERVGGFDLGGINLRIHQMIALLTIAALLWQKIRLGQMRFRSNPLLIPLAIFLLSYLVSVLHAINLQRAVMVYAFTVLVVVVALLVVELIRNREQLKQAHKVLLITAFGVSAFGLFQFVGDGIGLPPSVTMIREHWYNKEVIGVTRVHSTALEPLYFANFMLILLPTTLAMVITQTRKRLWGSFKGRGLDPKDLPFSIGWLIVMLMTMGLAFVLTLSRGGYLALAAAALVVFVLCFRDLLTKRVLLLGGSTALIGLLVLGITSIADSDLNFDFIIARSTSFAETGADLERLDAYRSGMDAFWQSPWFGVGPGNFGAFQTAWPSGAPPEGWGIVNNEYIELLAEAGLVGFALFAIAIGLLLWRLVLAWATCRDPFLSILLVGALGSFAGIFTQYISFSTLYIMHLWVFIGLSTALILLVEKRQRASPPTLEEIVK